MNIFFKMLPAAERASASVSQEMGGDSRGGEEGGEEKEGSKGISSPFYVLSLILSCTSEKVVKREQIDKSNWFFVWKLNLFSHYSNWIFSSLTLLVVGCVLLRPWKWQ